MNKPYSKEEQRFRKEAEELMGLSEEDRRDLISQYFHEIKPEDAKSFAERGEWHRSQGAFARAIEDFTEAIKLAPENAASWESRGLLRIELEYDEEGLADLGQALALARAAVETAPASGKQWDLWNRIALAHYRRHNWQGAELEAELAVELSADRPSLMMRIVPLYLLAGKHDEYRAVCHQLMERWQQWTGNDLGCAAAMCTLDPNPSDDAEQLMRLMQKAVDEGPEWSINHLHRAYCRTGDYQKAIEAIRATGRGGNLMLAIALHHAGQQEEARSCLNEALENWDETVPQYANPRLEREVIRHEAERLFLKNGQVSPTL